MFEVETPLRIKRVIRQVGFLKREQIHRFFADCEDANNIDFYVKQYLSMHEFDYDDQKDIVSWHGGSRIETTAMNTYIHAFWVIAAFPSESIREIIKLQYPFQYEFITKDDECYDITLCYNENVARIAYRQRIRMSIPDVDDDVNHIALVYNREDGEALRPYGFDSFCYLDKNHRPIYEQWD